MNNLPSVLLYFLAAACTQNLLLTAGLGSTLLLRMFRRPYGIRQFSLFLLVFSLLTSCTFYPIDIYLGTSVFLNMLRPLIVVGISAFWYILLSLVLKNNMFERFPNMRTMASFAAFNNIVVAVPLISNHQFQCNFFETIGIAVGACVGFMLIMWITREMVDRMNHDDMPKAFQGFPGLLLFLGILALALSGLASPISFT